MQLNQLHLSVRWQNLGLRYLTLWYLSKVSDGHHCLNGFFVNIPCLKTKYSREKSYLKHRLSFLCTVPCSTFHSHFPLNLMFHFIHISIPNVGPFKNVQEKENIIIIINQTTYVTKASTLIFWNKKATDLFKVSTSNEEISKWVPQLT